MRALITLDDEAVGACMLQACIACASNAGHVSTAVPASISGVGEFVKRTQHCPTEEGHTGLIVLSGLNLIYA